jgi:GntR family transcriptional regulator, arabinose operon transcriptional repressor
MLALSDIKVEAVPTKRRYIYQTLRHQILSRKMAAGSPFPSGSELTERFGVSHMTMQLALADLVRDGLLVRHRRKGTFTADTKTRKTRPLTSQLVVVLPPQADIDVYGQTEEVMRMLQGCTQGAAAASAHLNIVSLPSIPGARERTAGVKGILQSDGAIFFGNQYAAVVAELHRRKFPVVTLADDTSPTSRVDYDHEAAVRMAVDHLCGHGYRRIGFFGHTEGPDATKYRLFCRLLAEKDMRIDPTWVHKCTPATTARAPAQRFLSAPRLPDAVFVDNHIKTQAVISAAYERGLRLPDDLAIVGYAVDTSALAEGQITMVRVPYEAMGREGAILLDKIIRGSALPPVAKTLQPQLVLRQSCGCKESATDGEADRGPR